jgi:hypothetical protein
MNVESSKADRRKEFFGLSLFQALLGLVALNPTYIFSGVIAKCETQHRPISEPSPKSFNFDLAGRFFGRRLV